MGDFVEKEVSSWGRYPKSTSCVFRPERWADVETVLRQGRFPTCLARGLGRSYGDAALNLQGGLLLMERLNRFLSFDPAGGRLRCESGVTIKDILEVFVPRGWFLPVTPGTQYVTMGGALACDVHGKNHHKHGSISEHVEEFLLLRADGKRVRCSKTENPELFWATAGGLGLTGIIVELTLRLRPITSAFMKVDYDRTKDLDETMGWLEEQDSDYDYSVAWIDCLASGSKTGRGVLIRGNHAVLDDLDEGRRARPLAFTRARRWSVPFDMPGSLLGRYSMRAFNSLYYHRSPRRRSSVLVDLESFFYPLDSLLEWNRLYGKRGFVQFQCVLPFETSRAGLGLLLERLSRTGNASFLAVLKRLGAEQGLLSFPSPGYTLAMDIPLSGDHLFDFLNELDQLVLSHGGKIYLAKDARMSQGMVEAMYPGLKEWRRIKKELDPGGLFSSDLCRRLQLAGSG
jgi:decaprenylphospho-beta-D-ribofuranose 2-oxidase